MRKAIIVLVVSLLSLCLLTVIGCGNGTTWTKISSGGMSSYGIYSIYSLACDPAHNMLYAGTDSGVWKYNGTTWTKTGGGVSDDEIDSLAYDSKHNVLYAGCYNHGTNLGNNLGKGVWKYNGTTWTKAGGGVSDDEIDSLAYDSKHNVLYAGPDGDPGPGVWKYDGTTYGTTWTKISSEGMDSYSPEAPPNRIQSLACDPAHNMLYAGTDSGVWKYNGTSWTNTGGAISTYKIRSLAYDSGHNVLYAGCYDPSTNTSKGVWEYNGTTWTKISSGGMRSDGIWSLAYDSVHNVLYAGTSEHGVWRR